jgi:hypothetical protein
MYESADDSEKLWWYDCSRRRPRHSTVVPVKGPSLTSLRVASAVHTTGRAQLA